jgi:hypothetical protein
MFTRGDGRGGAGVDGAASARCTVPFAVPFGPGGVLAGGSRIRITLRAVSSASSSAGSIGLDTLAGNRVHFENWTDGGVVILTGTLLSLVSRVCEAMDLAMRICVARLPRRSCNMRAGDRAFSATLR